MRDAKRGAVTWSITAQAMGRHSLEKIVKDLSEWLSEVHGRQRKVTTKTFRQSVITAGANSSEISDHTVAAVVGHKSLKSQQHYVKTQQSMRVDGAVALAACRSGSVAKPAASPSREEMPPPAAIPHPEQ